MRYLLIISCSARKVSTPELLPAIERYDGPTYRTLRKAKCEGWFPKSLDILIISAKYGLIPCRYPIDDYNQLMTPQRAAELTAEIQQKLKDSISNKPYDQVFINLGRTYRETLEGFHWGLVSTFETSGGIGLKTSQMKVWLERIRIIS